MTKVRDTSKDADTVGVSALLYGMEGVHPSQAILDQEKQGQKSFVNSTQIPVEGSENKEALFELLGFKLGPIPTEGDTLFREAELPEGWTKKGTEHDMHSELLDEKGRTRARVFYKAAFYDRKADIHIITRFTCGVDYSDEWQAKRDTTTRYVVWKDGEKGEAVWESVVEFPSCESDKDAHYEAKDLYVEEHGFDGGARKWLAENYPDWNDPAAYWDIE